MSKSSTKRLGLRLTLGGAPSTPHTIAGLPGLYRAGAVTPVGGPGEPSEDQAREADQAKGAPVEMVELSEKDLDDARQRHDEDLKAARGGVVSARRAQPVGAEVEQVTNELAATRG